MVNTNLTSFVNLHSLDSSTYDFTITNLDYTSTSMTMVNGTSAFAFQGTAGTWPISSLTTNGINLSSSPTIAGSVELRTFPYMKFVLPYEAGTNQTFLVEAPCT